MLWGALSSHFPGYPARKCTRESSNPTLNSSSHPTRLWQEGKEGMEVWALPRTAGQRLPQASIPPSRRMTKGHRPHLFSGLRHGDLFFPSYPSIKMGQMPQLGRDGPFPPAAPGLQRGLNSRDPTALWLSALICYPWSRLVAQMGHCTAKLRPPSPTIPPLPSHQLPQVPATSSLSSRVRLMPQGSGES